MRIFLALHRVIFLVSYVVTALFQRLDNRVETPRVPLIAKLRCEESAKREMLFCVKEDVVRRLLF